MPASNSRTDGGRGWILTSSCPTRWATTHFSLQVFTNSRYFWRLSKKRKLRWGSCGAGCGRGCFAAGPEMDIGAAPGALIVPAGAMALLLAGPREAPSAVARDPGLGPP